MPSKILITGGTGLVGTKLTDELLAKNHEVRILTTSALRAEEEDAFYWNLKDQYIDQRAFEGLDYIVHLAGAGVADKRWSEERKKVIYDSRIKNTALLCERAKGHGVKGIIAASAIGYYGFDTGDELMTEESERGDGFLSDVVVDWEREVEEFERIVDHVMMVRIGIVLSTEGGALKQMAPPFKLGVGSPLGNGKQWMSWIHIDDLVGMIIHGLENNSSGIFNAVAPNPERNKDFSKTLATSLNRPMWLPNVPAFILKIVFGELAQVVLGGNRVSAKKIVDAGYSFKFEDLATALTDLFKK
ncbi:MAG: TIGR01777 family oxidoreductase [Cyclobacteriaceae bacterium]